MTQRTGVIHTRLTAVTTVEYDSPAGQRIQHELPVGTILALPAAWIYAGVPDEFICPPHKAIPKSVNQDEVEARIRKELGR